MNTLVLKQTVPGGMTLFPLLSSTVTNTFSPDAGKYFGLFSSATEKGGATTLPAFDLFMGTIIALRTTQYFVSRSLGERRLPAASEDAVAASAPFSGA
ncbi:2-keto-3-deoxygluconate permease [Deinococcus sp. SM5_A1]|uniref:2-keto-3-deoxygluconate permease n=1 Tax=Deinococcus sp. SM5_A1 TaxID=3379094 RepID=UPI00385EEFCA